MDYPALPCRPPPSGSDACNSASVVQVSDVTTAGTCTGTYSEIKTWKAVDACGNQSGTVAQTITVRDITPPVKIGRASCRERDWRAAATFTPPTALDSL